MKSKERVKLTNWEKIEHFGISFWLLIPAIACDYFFIKDLLYSSSKIHDFTPLIVSFIFLFLSGYLFIQNQQRTYFEEYKGHLSDADFKRAIKLTAKELSWDIVELTNNYAKAFRYPESFGHGEERIIIKKTVHRLLINSMNNPEGNRAGYSSKRNKQNINIFALNAAQILRGEYVEKSIRERKLKKKEAFWNENEWSFGNIMMRIVGYGLFFLFLLIGGLFILENAFAGIFFILVSLIIGFIYIRADLKILREKRKRKQNQ